MSVCCDKVKTIVCHFHEYTCHNWTDFIIACCEDSLFKTASENIGWNFPFSSIFQNWNLWEFIALVTCHFITALTCCDFDSQCCFINIECYRNIREVFQNVNKQTSRNCNFTSTFNQVRLNYHYHCCFQIGCSDFQFIFRNIKQEIV